MAGHSKFAGSLRRVQSDCTGGAGAARCLLIMLTHTRSGEKKQKKKKAPLAFGTRWCALQSQDFQVIIVTLSHGRYGNVCITRNYQHGSSLVRMRPNLPVLFARDVVAEKRYKAWQSGVELC